MHGQKWERGRHLVLCKAKAVWLETSAASDPVLHDEKNAAHKVFPGKRTLSALIGPVFAGSSAPNHTLQLLLNDLWSCPLCPAVTGVTRRLRDGTETPSSGAQRKSFSLWPQIQHPLSLPRSGDKQRAAMSKEQRTCPAHIHAQWYTAAQGSPGSSQHHRQCHCWGHPPPTAARVWYHGTECPGWQGQS